MSVERPGSVAAAPESGWQPEATTTPAPPGAGPLGVTDRYDVIAFVGRGGMGHVHIAHDRILDRDVALKQARPDRLVDPATEARLAAEARITARLEHPGIVAVHDAGRTPDGHLFYVMRLVRGRSLADAIAAEPTLDARLSLLRAVLATTEAVAYAHREGVVHRDLKPANVMVGELGQVQVMDWGLAVRADDHGAAGVAGTPPYMSPEQERGAHANERSDVWSLGVILVELILGRPPGDVASGLAAVRATPSAPAELVAIAARCLARDPAARYPTAAALAEDLARYLDGRRVAAYSYPLGTLLRRAVRRWRLPLAVAAVAVAVLVAVLVVGGRRLVAERDRATRSLGAALAGQAVALLDKDQLPDAERVAREALAADPALPEARGALMPRWARPTLDAATALPRRCPIPCLDADGQHLLCVGDGVADLYDLDGASLALRWSLASPAIQGRVLAARDEVILVHPDDRHTLVSLATGEVLTSAADWSRSDLLVTRGVAVGANVAGVVVLDGGRPRVVRPCPRHYQAFALTPDERGFAAVCNNGEIRAGPLLGATSALLGHVDAPEQLTALAVDDAHLVWGSARAELGLLLRSSDGVTAGWTRRVPANVLDVQLSGGVIVAVLEGGQAVFVSLAGHDLGGLPRGVAARGLVPTPDGRLLTLSDALRSWRPPDRWLPHRLVFGAGLSGARPSPDGARIALALADGRVTLVTPAGAAVATVQPFEDVPREPSWRPEDGALVQAWSMHNGYFVFEPPEWRLRHIPGDGFRQVAALADGHVFGMSWGDLSTHFLDDRAVERPTLVRLPFRDVAISPSGRWGVLAGHELSVLVRVAPADDLDPRWIPVTGLPLAAAIADDGVTLVFATRETLARVDADTGLEVALAHLEARALDVALGPDGATVATAHDDGSVAFWDAATGALLARVHGHRARVATVAFAPSGAWAVSASWDRTARIWDLGPLGDAPRSSRAAPRPSSR